MKTMLPRRRLDAINGLSDAIFWLNGAAGRSSFAMPPRLCAEFRRTPSKRPHSDFVFGLKSLPWRAPYRQTKRLVDIG